jgi:hypothetical protein
MSLNKTFFSQFRVICRNHHNLRVIGDSFAPIRSQSHLSGRIVEEIFSGIRAGLGILLAQHLKLQLNDAV